MTSPTDKRLVRVKFTLVRATKPEAFELLENAPKTQLSAVISDLIQYGALYLKQQQLSAGPRVVSNPSAAAAVPAAGSSPEAAPEIHQNFLLQLDDSELADAWSFGTREPVAESSP